MISTNSNEIKEGKYAKLMQQACQKIAPLYPLDRFVAVNPFLGHTDKPFTEVVKDLRRKGGVQMTLPVAYYQQLIRDGKIKQNDLNKNTAAIEALASNTATPDSSIGTLLPTVSLKATELTGKDWTRFVVNRISSWAASYFDDGQAVWKATYTEKGIFASWKADASIDLSTELTGLSRFRKVIKDLPEDPFEAAYHALAQLKVPEDGLLDYFERLLYQTTGWAAHIARLDWEKGLVGKHTTYLIELLAIHLCWETALLKCMDKKLDTLWKSAKQAYNKESPPNESKEIATRILLQEAHDKATQRSLIEQFRPGTTIQFPQDKKRKAQAIFCIDVRSEVYRRNLELADPAIETLGFAGFFGFPINYVPIGHNAGRPQCPALLSPDVEIKEQIGDKNQTSATAQDRTVALHVKKAWKSFKSGAVSCFSFVSPMGLWFLPKLITDSMSWTRPVPHPDEAGLGKKELSKKTISVAHDHASGIPLEQQVIMAKNALKGMSLHNFAPLVLIVGHGSQSVNNPHATGYDCGACGGHTGEANAKVAAAVLNNTMVRARLKSEGVNLPDDTIFLACLHDTTTDEVTIFNELEVPTNRDVELKEIKSALKRAGHGARAERGLRMALKEQESDTKIMERAKDWSQTRPEWGLAGCSAFVVAPRIRTTDKNLNGKSFLHTYNWRKDENFGVLELIMTAPMVVTSWINLQYYASTVDNRTFGSGNKTLHNVTSGLGVLEGQSGDLRTGLPWQSVHDGEKYQHDPVRLNVVIEAPIDAMNEVLAKHNNVKNLCDNQWIFLLAMDDEGKISHRYTGDLKWEAVD